MQAANASELSHGDNVNMGGALVGSSRPSRPTRLPNGRPIALINVQLQNSIKPLPVDSKFTDPPQGRDRPEVPRDHARALAERGSPTTPSCRMRQASTEVDFDQVLSMFTPATRMGVQQTTIGFAQALAGPRL